jgi:hypothetical protein
VDVCVLGVCQLGRGVVRRAHRVLHVRLWVRVAVAAAAAAAAAAAVVVVVG